ncbi:MAG: hypothetical protein ABI321_14170 [Polyangia bacterium]
MRISLRSTKTLILGGMFTAGLLGGCLPKYNGTTVTEDMADIPNDPSDPPVGPSSGPEVSDLAGSVVIDAFTSAGAATLALSSPTSTLRLNETQKVMLTITANGESGSATLALAKAPPGVTATFTPATVTLGATPTTVTMAVTAASDMDPATSVAAEVQLNVGTTTSTTTYGLTVTNELLLQIPNGVDITKANPTAFGAASTPVKVKSGVTKITFVNGDGIEHRIHADGTDGIQHELNNMAASGGSYTQTLTNTVKGAVNFHCHIHPNMMGQIMVE